LLKKRIELQWSFKRVSEKITLFYSEKILKKKIYLDFRGYTLRKHKFTAEMEAKIKIILNTAKSRSEAQKLLQREKFRDEDIVRIIQKYFR
jgi:hypothetical protein